jgi:hypothetical protein
VELPPLESENSWETVRDYPAGLEPRSTPAKDQHQGGLGLGASTHR